MLGWIILREGGSRPQLQQRCVRGLPLLALEIAQPHNRRQERRVCRALWALRRRGVERVVVQGAVEEWWLHRCGLRTVPWGSLRQSLLPQLLDWAENVWGLELQKGTVLLRTNRTDEAVRRMALLLGQRARYVALDTGPGQAALERELQRRLGLGQGNGGQAMLQVCLGRQAPEGPAALLLGEEGRQQELRLAAEGVEEGCEMLFSALFDAGRVKSQEIEVKSVEFLP